MTAKESNKARTWARLPDGTGMIYLGMSPWQGMWKSRHQLMSRFSKVLPVLYVEPWVPLRSIRTGRTKLPRIVRDFFASPVKRHAPNVHVFGSTACRPVSGSALLGNLTRRHWLRAVRRAARSAGITRPILWISRPETGFAIGEFAEQLSIYHIVDEYTGYTGLDSSARRRLSEAEAKVLDRVDLAVAASPELVSAKGAPGRDIMLLENGVSPREYRDARVSGRVPADIGAIPRPRLGYSGLIGKRLNLELIGQIARQRADWSIVMIGKIDDRECEAQIAELQALANVHFLGEKQPGDVAQYITALDVGLLPYAVNLETQHISPIKMYEYWAAGKPAVATSIPAARRHNFAVSLADTVNDFIAKVEQSLNDFGETDRVRLVDLAATNSWQARVDQVAEEIVVRLRLKQTTEAGARQP